MLAKQLELRHLVAERPEEDALGSRAREVAEALGAELGGADRQREGTQRLDRPLQHRARTSVSTRSALFVLSVT